jgi:hypothetical protein
MEGDTMKQIMRVMLAFTIVLLILGIVVAATNIIHNEIDNGHRACPLNSQSRCFMAEDGYNVIMTNAGAMDVNEVYR